MVYGIIIIIITIAVVVVVVVVVPLKEALTQQRVFSFRPLPVGADADVDIGSKHLLQWSHKFQVKIRTKRRKFLTIHFVV